MWDSVTSSIVVPLPDLSFPIVIVFGIGIKIPEVKGGFRLSLPFKFGSSGKKLLGLVTEVTYSLGDIEDSSSEESEDESDGEAKAKGGLSLPKVGFKIGGKKKESDMAFKVNIRLDANDCH